MSTQFKNSNLAYYLYTSVIIIVGLATIVIFWFMFNGYRAGNYSENTLLGSVYLGGIDKEEVKDKVEARVNSWLGDDSIVFEATYQGYVYEFDRELLDFDITESVGEIKDGITNDLIVTYSLENRNIIKSELSNQIFLLDINTQFDLDAVVDKIIFDASYMKSFSSVELEDHLLDFDASKVLIHETTVSTPPLFDVNSLLLNINNNLEDSKIIVDSKSLFSVLDELSSIFDDEEMSIISSGILENIKYSNFVIHERSYNSEIDFNIYNISNFPLFGKQVRIDNDLDVDFSFYNPNDSAYEFTFSLVSANELKVTMKGLGFVDQIFVTQEDTDLNFITQETDDPNFEQDGQLGKIVEVNRRIINLYGETVLDGIIIFEFYPPIKQIDYEDGI